MGLSLSTSLPTASTPVRHGEGMRRDASTKPGAAVVTCLRPAPLPLWSAAGRGVGVHHCLSQRDKIARGGEGEREVLRG